MPLSDWALPSKFQMATWIKELQLSVGQAQRSTDAAQAQISALQASAAARQAQTARELAEMRAAVQASSAAAAAAEAKAAEAQAQAARAMAVHTRAAQQTMRKLARREIVARLEVAHAGAAEPQDQAAREVLYNFTIGSADGDWSAYLQQFTEQQLAHCDLPPDLLAAATSAAPASTQPEQGDGGAAMTQYEELDMYVAAEVATTYASNEYQQLFQFLFPGKDPDVQAHRGGMA